MDHEDRVRVLLMHDNAPDVYLRQPPVETCVSPHLAITEATSQTEALALLSQDAADVIVHDCRALDRPAIDLLSALAAHPAAAPVIVLTDHASASQAEQALKAGAHNYMEKEQITPTGLLHALRWARQQRRATQELAARPFESTFWLLIEKNADGILVIDEEGVILYANPAAEYLFGRQTQDLQGVQFGFPVTAGETTELNLLSNGGPPRIAEMRVVNVVWQDRPCYLASLRDVTERKAAENALREAKRNYEDLVNSIDGIVWEANAETLAFTFVSQQAERLLGYPSQDWIDDPVFWANHLHPDDQGWALGFCQGAIQRGEDHEFEYRMITADGRVIWVRLIVSLVCENDQIVKLRGVMLDITSSKALELEREQFYDLSIDMLCVAGTDGYFKRINPAFVTTLGYSEAELLSQSFLDIAHTDDRAATIAQLERLQSGQKVTHFENRYRTKDGAYKWMSWTAAPSPTDPSVVFAIARDNTDRRLAEEALRQSEQLYRTLARQLPDTAVMIFDRDLRFLLVEGDPLAEQGYSKARVEGKTLWEVLGPDSIARLEPHYRLALSGTESMFEQRYNEKYYYNHFLPVRDTRGEIFAGMIVSQDITTHKLTAQAEAEARADQALRLRRQREIQSLERYSRQLPSLDQKSNRPFLQQNQPEVFAAAVQSYGKALDLALEQRAYKVDHDISEELRQIAERIGRLLAGPRDVVELHLAALREKMRRARASQAQIYAEEGRLMALELMGYLALYYRSLNITQRIE